MGILSALLPIAGSVVGGVAGEAIGIGADIGSALGAFGGALAGGQDPVSSVLTGIGAYGGSNLLGNSSLFSEWDLGNVGDVGLGAAASATPWSKIIGGGIGSALGYGLGDLVKTPTSASTLSAPKEGPVDTTKWWGPRVLVDNPYVSLDYAYPEGPGVETRFFNYV